MLPVSVILRQMVPHKSTHNGRGKSNYRPTLEFATKIKISLNTHLI